MQKIFKPTIYSIITIILLVFIFILFWIIPVYKMQSEVLNLYTTISDPKDFNHGINIDSSVPYSVNICWYQGLFTLEPRYVIAANSYLIEDRYDTDVYVMRYARSNLFSFQLEPKELAILTSKKSYADTVKIFNNWCNVNFNDASIIIRTYDQLLKYKSDAQNPPQIDYNDPAIQQKIKAGQQVTPDLTQEELDNINKIFNEREKK